MIKIYHNPRCKKSRAGLVYLKSKTDNFTIVKYLSEEPFSKDSLERVIKKLDVPVEDIIRKQETVYKQKYKGKEQSREAWIEAMVENPKLIGRPLVEKEGKAVLGDPPENIDKLF